MNNQGVLVVVSGFSGAGKGTLMKALLTKYDNYALSISATTRNPREGEEDGREYFFKTREEFEQMIENDELVEFPYGYHTTVSTPGYQTYFLWLMAGDYQGFNRSNDPEHDWVK